MRTQSKRWPRIVAALVVAALAIGAVEAHSWLRLLAGYAAKCAASARTVGDRDLRAIAEEDLAAVPLVSVSAVDGGVAARALWVVRRAFVREGLGATLVPGADRPVAPPAMPWAEPLPTDDEPLVALDPPYAAALHTVVERAFATAPGAGLAPRAVLVRLGGRLVAERYGEGFGRSDPMLGWSMAKTVTACAIGLLVERGALTPDAPAPVAEWREPGDPRAAITLDHLLRMSSGLAFDEVYTDPRADAARMLFEEADMAAFAASHRLAHPPGTRFEYSSGTTNLLARIARDAAGGTSELVGLLRERLFAPIGMHGAVVELDASGTPVGSSYVWATARGWSRFGQLLLDRGRAGGARVVAPGWIDYMRAPAPAARRGEFGAHLWLNVGGPDGPGPWPDCPPDACFAAGHNGQLVAVVPSRDAVIVRLAWDREGVRFDANRFVAEVLSALP